MIMGRTCGAGAASLEQRSAISLPLEGSAARHGATARMMNHPAATKLNIFDKLSS
jgi:hypothetical protein